MNMENYVAIVKSVRGTRVKLRFIDSFRFMNSPLGKLSSFLSAYPILNSQFKNMNESKLKLLHRKGVYPYDYVTSSTKLKDIELPDIKAFYNKLNDADISEEEYRYAKNVWNTFNVKTLGKCERKKNYISNYG